MKNLLEIFKNIIGSASGVVSIAKGIKGTEKGKELAKTILIVLLIALVCLLLFVVVQNKVENTEPTTGTVDNTTTQVSHVINEEVTTTCQSVETTKQSDDKPMTGTTTTRDDTTAPSTSTPAVNNDNRIENGGGSVNVNSGSGTIVDSDFSVSGNQNNIIVNQQTTTEVKITVSNVVISDKNVSLKIGESKRITATVIYSDNSKDNNVIWTSSNEAIASVDEQGNITAISSGTVKIVAQASKNNSTKQEECTVKVIAPPSGYTIRLSAYTVPMNSKFKVYVEPYEDDYEKITIYGKSPSGKIYEFVLNDEGYEIYEEPGEWTIYAKVKNDAGEYVANKPEDYAKIKVEPIDIDSILNGMIKT